jgi:uncharacterized coiled-coil DUF342 family protein
MAQPSSITKMKQTETEVAILQVQYRNIEEKVDELKNDLKDLRTHLDTHAESTQALIKEFQATNTAAHLTIETKISTLEKWRWMLMGAGVLAGSAGFPLIQNLFG